MQDYSDTRSDEAALQECYNKFCLVASVQGRIAYFLMSVHAVNPFILGSIINFDPFHILFKNMIYGCGVLIFWRPFLNKVYLPYRLSFR